MKKICLLCLLAISMSFASLKVEGFSCYQDGEFQLVNQNGKKIQGFKLVVYRNVDDASRGVKVAEHSSLAGAKISLERLSARLYKVELDFSNATIPAGGTFPSADKYLSVKMADLNGKVFPPRALIKCAYERHESPDVVVISSGKILWGEHTSVPREKRMKSLFIWIQRIAIMKMV